MKIGSGFSTWAGVIWFGDGKGSTGWELEIGIEVAVVEEVNGKLVELRELGITSDVGVVEGIKKAG